MSYKLNDMCKIIAHKDTEKKTIINKKPEKNSKKGGAGSTCYYGHHPLVYLPAR